MKKLRSFGIATTPDEMPKPGPDSQNAALIYQTAIRLKAAIKFPRPMLISDSHLQAKLDAYVKSNQPVMDLVRKASALPDCNFNRDWSLGPRLAHFEFPALREFTKLAVLIAEREAHAGRFGEAFAWLEVGRKISVHVREPSLIAYSASISCELTVLRELQREIREYCSYPQFVKLSRQFCETFPALPYLRNALSEGVLSVRIAMADIGSGRVKAEEIIDPGHSSEDLTTPDGRLLFALRVPSVRLRLEQNHLTTYRRAVEAIPADPKDLLTTIKATQALDEIKPDRFGVGDLAGIFLPWFEPSARSLVSLAATRNLTRQGLDVYVIKAKTGSFPKEIDKTRALGDGPLYREVTDVQTRFGWLHPLQLRPQYHRRRRPPTAIGNQGRSAQTFR
ncbi:MAG: hypothetical protein ABL949_02815 [Fimbriimonadaceae bacterium]